MLNQRNALARNEVAMSPGQVHFCCMWIISDGACLPHLLQTWYNDAAGLGAKTMRIQCEWKQRQCMWCAAAVHVHVCIVMQPSLLLTAACCATSHCNSHWQLHCIPYATASLHHASDHNVKSSDSSYDPLMHPAAAVCSCCVSSMPVSCAASWNDQNMH